MQQRIYGLTLCLFLFTLNAFAQKGNGKLTGKVSDGTTNETLAGVTISAKGTKYGTTSITDGTYILALPPGTYTMRYSYTGHKIKEITGVVVKSGESTFLDIILETATKELEGVVVSANIRREAQSAVYSQQKRSAAVSDGISIEAIRKTPDYNTGQVLRRVPGVNVQDSRFVVVRGLSDQYNQTVLNGAVMTSTESNRSAFAFDLIPAAVLDNITVNKTATPDMPGNFGGGVVQVNTKDFPANDFFSILVQGGVADGTYRKDFYGDKRNELEWLGYGGNARELPKGFPSSTSRNPLVYMNQQEQYNNLRKLKNNLAPVNYGPSSINPALQLGYGKTFKFKNETQFGIVGALNYRKTEFIEQESVVRDPWLSANAVPHGPTDSVIGALTAFNATRYRYAVEFGGILNFAYRFGNNKITLKNFYTNVFNNTFIDRPDMAYIAYTTAFPLSNHYRILGLTYVVEQKGIINSILGGEHRTGKNNETRIDWNVNATIINTNAPDLRNYVLTYDSVSRVYGTTSNSGLAESLLFDSRVWSRTEDHVYGGVFNVTTPFNLLQNKQLFKTGILYQQRSRENTGLLLPIAGLYAPQIDQLLDLSRITPQTQVFQVGSVSLLNGSGNYTSGSSLIAGYESMENTIKKKIRIIWGFRVESYQQAVNLYQAVYYTGFAKPDLQPIKFAARSTYNFLPSANIVYSPIPDINIRGAYSNTVIRPELKDLAPYQRFDLSTFSLASGNDRLKSSSLHNYDLKFEWFPSSGEIISFSAFYKDIIDPIEYARLDLQNAISAKQAFNSGKAYVKGLETEMRKKLDFIPFAPWLSHVSIFGNASILRSKVSGRKINSFVLSSFNEHRLSGQPDYIINAGLTVNAFNNSFEFTASYNKTGDYINELGSSDQWVHLKNGAVLPQFPPYWVRSRDMVDVVISQSLLKNKMRLKLNISNLLKKRYIVYQDLNGNGKFDAPALDIYRQYNDPVHGTGYYKNGIDNTPSNIAPQRSFSFALSYTF